MSRGLARNGASAPSQGGQDEDICPVCRSSRYLNPTMRFLVNPECYHKMCSSCIDRLFTSGPGPCPIPGCPATLRKARFRPQTFSDITVEKEVDKRRMLAKIFNRKEEEFETLRDWNDYLQEVEDLTFDLIHGISPKETMAKIKQYELDNAESITANNSRAKDDDLSYESRQAAERAAAKRRREAARQHDEAERAEKTELRYNLLDKLTTSEASKAKMLSRETQNSFLKKSSSARSWNNPPGDRLDGKYTIRGLKAISPKDEDLTPFDPFGGALPKQQYFTLQANYEYPWLDEARKAPKITAGGYKARDYCARSLFEAFAGLGVFLDEELDKQDQKPQIAKPLPPDTRESIASDVF